MVIFGLLFLIVALILIGAGIAGGLIAGAFALLLIAVGVVSSSVVAGLLSRRPSAGVRAFIIQCALLAGIPAGILCAWTAHSILTVTAGAWMISLYGALGGALAGLVVAVLLELVLRRLHRWITVKFDKTRRHAQLVPVV